ncbi:MAG: hypothetical protein V4580_17405 [Bacteroidota bacterium]
MKSTEELCIEKIKAGMRAIKLKSKTPAEANCGFFFTKLKPLNDGMHDDLMKEYKTVMETHNKAK